MNKKWLAKLRDRSGESIGETLVALLVSSLALVMLAGAISSAHSLITRSDAKMTEYYQNDNALAERRGAQTAEVTISEDSTEEDALTPQALQVAYDINGAFGGTPVTAYRLRAGF